MIFEDTVSVEFFESKSEVLVGKLSSWLCSHIPTPLFLKNRASFFIRLLAPQKAIDHGRSNVHDKASAPVTVGAAMAG